MQNSRLQSEIFPFPTGFLWGAATSSHQVEGDNRWNDWWEYEQAGHLPYVSGDACRHYHLYEHDFDLVRALGHNAHRFSIEWSRVEPAEGQWNVDAIAHYRAVIQALRQRSLEPIVTLHHFTNPAWFAHRGGWLRHDSPRLFTRYVSYVAEQLGAEVRYWLTINEPTVYVQQGYINGEWPPCLKAAWLKATFVFKNLARAHVGAYRALHDSLRDVMVGFAHSALPMVPCNPSLQHDRVATTLRDLLWNRAFFALIKKPGGQNGRGLDFIGLNYYTRTIVRGTGWGLGAIVGRACQLPHHGDRGPMSATGWEVYPPGFTAVLEKFSRFGLPLFVTENGVATDDETLRRDFLWQHLQCLAKALEKGIHIIGYLYWTLMDNFEWTLGTAAHFGMAAVDFDTQQRLPRPSAEDFARVCRENRLPTGPSSRLAARP
jgi:beta-glucosidase